MRNLILCCVAILFVASGFETAKAETNSGVSTSNAQLPSAETPTTSDAFGSLSIGHLVTPNNTVLKKNGVAVGTLYAGYGLTDHLTIGTSPWIWQDYQMANLLARWATNISAKSRIGFDAQYFKSYGDESAYDQQWQDYCSPQNPDSAPNQSTCHGQIYPYGFTSFEMEAWVGKFTYNYQILPWYRVNIATSYYYFVDDARPFSLRMDPQNDDRYALNLTSLHEFRLGRGTYFEFEIGSWGLNYTYPYYHLGATIDLQGKSYLIGLGASTTFSPSIPDDQVKAYVGYTGLRAIHPEIQIELFL